MPNPYGAPGRAVRAHRPGHMVTTLATQLDRALSSTHTEQVRTHPMVRSRT
jgi:hypothetical protein